MNNDLTRPLFTEDEEDDEYGYVINAPETQPAQHSDAHPFCYDPSCPCHEDSTFIDPVYQAYQEGELTAEEATEYVNDKLIYGGWSDDDDEE